MLPEMFFAFSTGVTLFCNPASDGIAMPYFLIVSGGSVFHLCSAQSQSSLT
jgi:hypothetical protein